MLPEPEISRGSHRMSRVEVDHDVPPQFRRPPVSRSVEIPLELPLDEPPPPRSGPHPVEEPVPDPFLRR